MKEKIKGIIEESLRAKEDLFKTQIDHIAKVIETIIGALKNGGKIILFGNGGSAADSQHIAAELIGRFRKERAALPAVSLTTNTSIVTAISNDYGYDLSFRRQIEGMARPEDIAVGISTSGNAKNVLEAVTKAKEMGLTTVGLTGSNGGRLAKIADITLKVPSDSTPRIQEMHITVGHIICELVEDAMS